MRRRAREEAREQRELRAVERRERRREAWPRWTAWWEARAKELKIAATVVGSAGVIAGGAVAVAKKAGAVIAYSARRALSLERGAGAPDQPKGDDMATLAPDRFRREHPPDGGTTK